MGASTGTDRDSLARSLVNIEVLKRGLHPSSKVVEYRLVRGLLAETSEMTDKTTWLEWVESFGTLVQEVNKRVS